MGGTSGHRRGLARARPRGDEKVATVIGGGPSLLGGQSGQVEHVFEHTPQGGPGGRSSPLSEAKRTSCESPLARGTLRRSGPRVEREGQSSPCKFYNFCWVGGHRSGGGEAGWTATSRRWERRC